MAVEPDPPVAGDKAARHWAKVADAIHDKVGGKISERKTAALGDVLERFERELGPHLVPFLGDLQANPNVPGPIRDLLAAIVEPEHFTQSLLIGFGLGAVLGPVLGTAIAPYVQTLANEVWPTDPSVPLSAEIAAAARLKGVLTQAEQESWSAKTGVAPNVADILYNTAGQAPGIEQGLLLLRRGQISEAEFERIVKYSNVRIDFLADILDLKYSPVSAGEAITGALKGHLDPATAQEYVGHAGIDPANFDWLLASAGRPPGIEQMLHLWNRGVATQADVEAAVKQSDVNDAYLPFVLELRKYFPPPRSVVPMLKSGAITETQARTLLTYYGVDAEWVTAFIKEATGTTASTVKELSASLVIRGYEQKVITQAEALSRLEALKYSAADAALYLELADANVTERLRDSATTRIHNRYITYKIDRAAAAADLGKIGQPAAAASQLLTFWDDERSANVAVLTMSQIQQGYHRGVLTLPTFIAMAQERGFSGLSVKILAAEAWPPTAVPPAVLALNPADL